LSADIKEKLRIAVLDAVFRVLRDQRKKTHPPRELLVEFISKDIRRFIERLSEGLAHRRVPIQYFILYRGSNGRRAFKLVKVSVEDMVALKAVIELHKPDWAFRSKTYPLVHPLPDDDCFPFVCFWPQMQPCKRE